MRVRRETVAEQCVELLRREIFELKRPPGTVVTEEAMGREMGVSRPTVREVLNTLTIEGLLTRNPTTRVLSVTRPGKEKIREIYRVRRLLETGGVMAFAEQEDRALEPLITATDRLVDAIDTGDYLIIVKSDIDCHVALVGLAGSTDLTDFYSRLMAKLQLAMADVSRSPRFDHRAMRDDHLLFVQYMRLRRLDEARELIVNRLNGAEVRLLQAAATEQLDSIASK